MLLGKRVLKICSRFTGENSCRSMISIKLQSKLPKNSSVGLLLKISSLNEKMRQRRELDYRRKKKCLPGNFHCLFSLVSIKLVSTIFYQVYIFSPNDSPSKCFLFYQKSSFSFRDIQNFAIFPIPFHFSQI